jgi:hypothetical protein
MFVLSLKKCDKQFPTRLDYHAQLFFQSQSASLLASNIHFRNRTFFCDKSFSHIITYQKHENFWVELVLSASEILQASSPQTLLYIQLMAASPSGLRLIQLMAASPAGLRLIQLMASSLSGLRFASICQHASGTSQQSAISHTNVIVWHCGHRCGQRNGDACEQCNSRECLCKLHTDYGSLSDYLMLGR